MEISSYLPFWKSLSSDERKKINENHYKSTYRKNIAIANSDSCNGLLIVKEGKIRIYTTSDTGREITLYNLYDYDICLLSSSCIFNSVTFEVMIEAGEDSTVFWIPPEIYKVLMKSSIYVANYTNELMADRFSGVMWLLDQVLNKKMDYRLALFLLEESNYLGSDSLKLTHEQISRNLGTAREVVSRLLKYFQNENIIQVSRGTVKIINKKSLEKIIT